MKFQFGIILIISILATCTNNGNQVASDKCIDLSIATFSEIRRAEVSVSKLRLGDTVKKMKALFGSPTQSFSYDNELDNRIHIVYVYDESSFEFSDSVLVSFEIGQEEFIIDNLNIHVGDLICSDETIEELHSNKLSTITLPVRNSDEVLELTINQANEITRIVYVVYW